MPNGILPTAGIRSYRGDHTPSRPLYHQIEVRASRRIRVSRTRLRSHGGPCEGGCNEKTGNDDRRHHSNQEGQLHIRPTSIVKEQEGSFSWAILRTAGLKTVFSFHNEFPLSQQYLQQDRCPAYLFKVSCNN